LNRRVLRFGAIIGAATVTTFATAPAFAATTVSQATAQAIHLSIAGNSAVSQIVTSSNDGTTETKNDASTVPPLAGIIPGNNALSAGVAVQNARSFKDGTSYACAGIAGTGGGLVTVGNSSCNIDGEPLTLDLGSLNLDLVNLLGGEGAITSALNDALGPILEPLGDALDDVLSQLTGSLAGAGLDLGIAGGLSAVEATCTADPDAAQGSAEIVDTSGDNTIPISLTLPGVPEPLAVLNLDVSMPGKPGGTDVLVNLDQVTQALIDALETQIETMLGGAIADLSPVIEALVQPLQDALIEPLVDALEPVLQAVSDNILKLVVNDVTPGDGGKSVSVTTLKVDVLPAAAQFTGSSLISGEIGKVTCGPNARPATTPPTTPENPENPESPEVPTVVDSGLAGNGDNTARAVLGATAALMLLAGTAGLVGYRRRLTK